MARVLQYVGEVEGATVDGDFVCYIHKPKGKHRHYESPFNCSICHGRSGAVPLAQPMRVEDRHSEKHAS